MAESYKLLTIYFHVATTYLNYFKFQTEYNVVPANEIENLTALKIFTSNLKSILKQKIKYYAYKSSFLTSLNKFSAIEDKSLLTGLVVSNDEGHAAEPRAFNLPVYPAPPASLDYRNGGYLNPIQDQSNYDFWNFVI